MSKLSNKKDELEFRRELKSGMQGKWLLTWHEDGVVNPGVPDVSYVSNGPGRYQTGWLELKATGPGEIDFHIESSQIQWIGRHAERIPVHFLIKVKGVGMYLFDGQLATAICTKKTVIDLLQLKHRKFTDFNTLAAALADITRIY